MADSTNTDIILDIQVRYEDAINGIAKYSKAKQDLSKANADLKKQLDKELISEEEYHKAIAANNEITDQYSKAIRVYRKEIQNNIAVETKQEGSLKSLRAQLSNATREFDELGRAAREGAEGIKKLEEIKTIQTELIAAEEASGRFQRNVGNYSKIGQDMTNILSSIDPKLGAVIQKLQQSSAFANTFGKSNDFLAKKLKISAQSAATLQFALVGLVAIGIIAAIKAYKEWREEQNAVNKSMLEMEKTAVSSFAEIGVTLDVLTTKWNKLGDSFEEKKKFVNENKEAFDKLGVSVNTVQDAENLLINNKDSFREAMLAKARSIAAMELATQKYKEALEAQIIAEEAQAKMRDTSLLELLFLGPDEDAIKSLHDYNENMDIYNQAMNIYDKSIEKNIENENKYKSAIDESKVSLSNVTNASTSLIDKQRELLKQAELLPQQTESQIRMRNKAIKSIQDEINRLQQLGIVNKENKNTSIEERKAAVELAKFKLQQDIQSQKDILNNDKNSYEERLVALNTYQNLQRAYILKDKEFQLKQSGLTESQKQLIKEQSNAKLLALDKELGDSALKLMQDNEAKELNALNTNINNRLALVKKGSDDELRLKIEQLDLQYQAEIDNANKIGADTKVIYDKYEKERAKASQEQTDYLNIQRQIEFQNEVLRAKANNENYLAIQLQAKQAELDSIRQLETESEAEYLNRQLLLQSQLEELKNQQIQWVADQQTQVLQAASTIAGGIGDLFETMSEQSESFAAFSKAVALFQIGVETAVALTKGISQSQSVPFPGNLAAIAVTVATILANIVKAKKYLTSAKQPKAPSYASGGLIRGIGSGTSDSIVANVSNGESVLNARATAMFSPILSAFNQIGGGVPISTQDTSSQVMGEEMIARSVAKAFAMMPNPVVSVEEINDVNKRVSILEGKKIP